MSVSQKVTDISTENQNRNGIVCVTRSCPGLLKLNMRYWSFLSQLISASNRSLYFHIITSFHFFYTFVFNISIMPKSSVLKSITIRHPMFLLKANEMWFFETCADGLGSRRPSERSDDLPKSSVKHWRAGWMERLSCWARVKTRLL